MKILLLDNNQADSTQIDHLLSQVKSQAFQLTKFQDFTNISNFLQQHHFDLILSIVDQGNSSNLDTLLKVKEIDTQDIPIVLISAQANFDLKSLPVGVVECLTWSEMSLAVLEKTILFTLKQHQYIKEVKRLKQENLELSSELSTTKDLFQTIVDSTSTLVWMIDAQGNFTFLNQAWLSFSGQTLATGLQENWQDRIHPEDIAKCNKVYQAALSKCQGFQIEYRLKRFDNKYRTILNTAVHRYNSKGEFAGLLCSCLDITQRKKAESKIIQQAKTERILSKITQDIHSSLELDIILQTAAEQVHQFLLADKTFITKVIDDQQLVLLFESSSMNALSCETCRGKKLPVKELKANFEQLSQGAIVACSDTDKYIVIHNSCADFIKTSYPLLLIPIISDLKLWGLLCIKQQFPAKYWRINDLELLQRVVIQLGIAIKQAQLYQKLAEANQELEKLSVVDGLTKIANRRKFDQYIATEWTRLAREQNPLSLILSDIDHFKLYNDTYGHQAGDRCLYKVAQAISQVVKRPADLVARYGGEEFVLVLPNTDLKGAKHIAQQVRLQIEALKIPHINSPVDLYVTLSLGVSCCIPNSDSSCDVLVAAADRGLYQSKEMGRNRVVDYEIKPE
ncbi:MAG: diguanylate cyclase domain-containing protein [Pleurocapsa sp.]